MYIPKTYIEAECRDCKQKIVDGQVLYRSLDTFDNDLDPYCPNCGSNNLKFLPTNEDFPKEEQ